MKSVAEENKEKNKNKAGGEGRMKMKEKKKACGERRGKWRLDREDWRLIKGAKRDGDGLEKGKAKRRRG